MLPSLIAGLLAFTGLPAGALLARLAQEEVGLPMAAQYFRALRGVLAALIVWTAAGGLRALFPFIGSLGQFSLTLGALLMLMGRKERRRTGQGNWAAAYALWGLLLGLLAGMPALGQPEQALPPITLVAGLVFLYGFVEASLRPLGPAQGRGEWHRSLIGPIMRQDLLFFASFAAGALAVLII